MSLRSIILPFLLFLVMAARAQSPDQKPVEKIRLLEKALLENHIEGKSLSGKIAERLPMQFIAALDPSEKFLTVAEVNELTALFPASFPYSDEELARILEVSARTMEGRYDTISQLISAIPAQDFFAEDSVFLSFHPDRQWAENESQLAESWRKSLKYAALSNIPAIPEAKSKEAINGMLNDQLLKEKEVALCKWHFSDQENHPVAEQVLDAYLNATATSYDPHTEYIGINSLNLFVAALSDKAYSSGLMIAENKGKFVIKEILPFSPASDLAEEITIGDQVISLKINNEQVHPACVSSEILDLYFNTMMYDSVILRLRRQQDQTIREVALPKQQLANAGNHIYSFLLQDDAHTIGYIDFPSFYSQFGGDEVSSSKDLAYAILRMKKNNPGGLILDMRNNGGGSVAEAIDLAGFFVNIGPLFHTESLADADRLIIDRKRGKIFTGKIMILINEFSASAAEMVTSAMQNYPGVLVVGSESYGKSTGQIIVPLTLPGEPLPFGSVKVTNLKIRGVNGVSYQGGGIRPDIALPSLYGNQLFSESTEPYSLEIGEKTVSARMPAERTEPVGTLRDSYRKRLQGNRTLLSVRQAGRELSGIFSEGVGYSLNYEDFGKGMDSLFARSFREEEPVFGATPIETDESFKLLSIKKKQKIETDPWLNEAFRIFTDWIKLTKN